MRAYEHAAQGLAALMEEKGVDRKTLSRETSIDDGILREILNGKRTTISTRNLLTFARYFDRSMRELVEIFG